MRFKFQIHRYLVEGSQSPVDSSFNGCSKASKISPLVYSGLLVVGIFLFPITELSSVAHSATYYLSPSGSNTNVGTQAAPWKTFNFAIPKLQPSDTLILKNGTYDNSNSGFPVINCSKGAKNGTSANPIVLKAENERQAFIRGNGSTVTIQVLNCSYWNFEGLRARSGDYNGSSNGSVFKAHSSNHLQFKRLLLTHNNRYKNSHLLIITNSNNVLVEECEFYYFHRHALIGSRTNGSIIRRNYANSRGYAEIPGGYGSAAKTRGGNAVTFYPGSNNTAENNISEGNTKAVSIPAISPSIDNKILGNISLNDSYGVVLTARGVGSEKMPRDNFIENLVAVSPSQIGVYARGAKNTQVKNVSVFGGSSGLVADFASGTPGDGIYSFFSTNSLANNVTNYGFKTIKPVENLHKFPASFKPKYNFSSNDKYSNEETDDPKLGTCKVFIPQSSPLKGQGENGADIGANVLYRYQDGVLTDTPLWNVDTGKFTCGAQVGVNDIPGSSCFDVHERLNVNTNGCLFPDGYGEDTNLDTKPPLPPTKVKIIS